MPGKKFSPPRPSGREGLMFPPEQFLKLRDLYRTEMRGATDFYNFFYESRDISKVAECLLVELMEKVVYSGQARGFPVLAGLLPP
jgi:hypothetical protein